MKSTYVPKTYVVGDVHGCYRTLTTAFDTIGLRDEDTIISTGDIVDRGPRIKDCLDFFLRRKNCAITLGNHDIAFIESALDPIAAMTTWKFMKPQGLRETLHQLGNQAPKYARLLKKKAVYVIDFETAAKVKYVICHSTWNWHEGESFDIQHTWERWYSDKEKPVDKVYKDYMGPIIVHGHDPVGAGSNFEEKVAGRLIGINLDGGCYYGGPTACIRVMCLDDGKIYEQPNLDV